jgi:hypothetical protein
MIKSTNQANSAEKSLLYERKQILFEITASSAKAIMIGRLVVYLM